MTKPRASVTIVDIARIAGVSKSTVSRALSGAGNISPEAKDRILEAVDAAGYRRNDLARSLRRGRTGMVGLLIPDIANPFWADVARGAQDEAAEDGTSVLIFNSDWDPERERRHLRALVQSRVDGAIVNPVRDGLDEIAGFDIPMVLIGSSAARFPQVPSVGSDIAQGVALGLDRIAAAGLGLPAFIVGDAERSARERFLNAVRDWAKAAGLPAGGLRIADGHYTVEGGRAAMAGLLAEGSTPRAVFAANDLMALGALQAVRGAGLACPADVSILGFDGIPAGEVSEPQLSTVIKPARQIGARAVRLLIDRIGGRGEARHVILPCEVRMRGSLRTEPARQPALAG